MTQMLNDDARFAGFTVVRKLSTRHDGEREVYLVTPQLYIDRNYNYEPDDCVVMTVFNLQSKKYQVSEKDQPLTPDVIDEVRFLRAENKLGSFVPVLDCGIEKIDDKELVWITQPRIFDYTVADEIRSNRGLFKKDALKVMDIVTKCIEDIVQFTKGGGHYNITPDNILLDYRDCIFRNVYLIGLADMGPSYQGSAPVSDKDADNRFRAPESANGVFNRLSDIYSFGLIMMMMLTGDTGEDLCYPNGFDEDSDEDQGEPDFSAVVPAEFITKYLERMREKLKRTQRLIIQRAVDLNPANRYQSIEKFQFFVDKFTQRWRKEDGDSESSDAQPLGNTGTPVSEKVIPRTESRVSDKAKAKEPEKRDAGNGLDDVAGMDELKDLFRRNFVRIVRNPKIAKAYGITPCNCTLLYGPQGCGKTFIAEKAAQESGLKYKIVNPSDLGSIYIHGSQEKIAETFKEAEKNAPMILIFDEFDAIAPKRDGDTNPHQANEVNELLTRLNNCAEKGVYVIATTNRPQMLDTAVLRSGRTDLMFYVSLPDVQARRDIFALELKKRPCADDIDLDILANATENFTCSDLSFVVKECARRCFDETIASGSEQPIPLDQSRILNVIKSTHSSVSEEEMKTFKEVKEKMEHRNERNRQRIGFAP